MSSCWGYQAHNGPQNWHKDFPIAAEGKRQSPIDICSGEACKDDCLHKKPLLWTYSTDKSPEIINTGQSWMVKFEDKNSCLKGGPLENDEYELWQFHAHWGKENSRGSEHTVDKKCYPAELHLVHWNRSKYSSPNEAVSKPDGLAVLGLFMEVVDKPHEEFDKVSSMLQSIQFKDDTCSLAKSINVAKFLPDKPQDNAYWTYEGSLTTPPLLECVTWIVFKKPMQISQSQLDSMRSLKCCCRHDHDHDALNLVDNYRPPCSLGSRTVREA